MIAARWVPEPTTSPRPGRRTPSRCRLRERGLLPSGSRPARLSWPPGRNRGRPSDAARWERVRHRAGSDTGWLGVVAAARAVQQPVPVQTASEPLYGPLRAAALPG
ncbi:hypothetical protein TPA0909_04980 [Streptomyces albus]|nr:hypothetical protein TPA0909_04980 [Streptomyces albus]